MNTELRPLHCLMLLPTLITLLALAHGENQFVYSGFCEAKLQPDGSAEIHPNGLLQLTNTSTGQIGHAFYKFPINFTASLSFSTYFVFAIVPEPPSTNGDGLAFAVSPSLNFSKEVLPGPFLGLFSSANVGTSSNHVLAVEFDTVANALFKDINNNHVGIDVNGMQSNVSAPAQYFSDAEGINKSLELTSGDSMQVWIDYDGVEKFMKVTIAPLKSAKPNQPLLSTSIDLSPIFLDSMYVGFSAATGPVEASNHYITGWSFNTSGPAHSLELKKLPSFPRPKISRNVPAAEITVVVISVSIVMITVAVTVYILRRRKYAEIREYWEVEYGPNRFSFKDLYKATKGFKDTELLGVGGFGKVYKGILPSSNAEVAVKKVSHSSTQGMREFVAEIASMGRLRHRNLVALLGYCRRKEELLLVYDYMPKGSLDKFVHRDGKSNLNWGQRYQIIRGIASGLLYLHEEWEQIVLHRDIKASNVLLDADFNGRLGDFGLARLYDHGTNPQTTHVVGTVGYLAPELTRTGKATTSTDVFAFGAFLLEVACGRKPIDLLPEDMVLVDWVVDKWKQGDILEARDSRLGGEFVVKEMELVLKLGLLCSHSNPVARPSMRQVMQYLNGDAILPDIVVDAVGFGNGMFAVGNIESNEFLTSFPSSCGKISGYSTYSLSSTGSILRMGH